MACLAFRALLLPPLPFFKFLRPWAFFFFFSFPFSPLVTTVNPIHPPPLPPASRHRCQRQAGWSVTAASAPSTAAPSSPCFLPCSDAAAARHWPTSASSSRLCATGCLQRCGCRGSHDHLYRPRRHGPPPHAAALPWHGAAHAWNARHEWLGTWLVDGAWVVDSVEVAGLQRVSLVAHTAFFQGVTWADGHLRVAKPTPDLGHPLSPCTCT